MRIQRQTTIDVSGQLSTIRAQRYCTLFSAQNVFLAVEISSSLEIEPGEGVIYTVTYGSSWTPVLEETGRLLWAGRKSTRGKETDAGGESMAEFNDSEGSISPKSTGEVRLP